ncbi:NinE family protein [Salmonella enterica]|nr:NinE family protein [Salmonella enterica]MCH5835073.1 NinE family protein [Salmonella enterica]MCH5839661.1 NinE family protein [Salmonella enterica]MCH5858797.1 NinE family protein [Salmonella enterica]MCH5863827.1 NinE family protein [Salmonella enterica]
MANLINRVMNGGIYKVPARRQRKPAVKPSDIPTLKGYTARLVDQKWLRLAARRNHA